MRSSAAVDIVLSRSAPSPTLSLIYQPWCSCAHLLSWASSSRGLLSPIHSLIYQLCAHVHICCRGHRPLVICSLSHTDSLIYQQWGSCAHLLSWASSSHGQLPPLTHSLIYLLWGSCAHLLSRTSSSRGLHPHRLSHLPAVVLSRVGERAPSP